MFQIRVRLIFLTSNLTTCHSLKTCIDKVSHNKRSDILHKFLNKTSGQIWGKKSQMTYNLKQREYINVLHFDNRWCKAHIQTKSCELV